MYKINENVEGYNVQIIFADVNPVLASRWLAKNNTKNRRLNKNHVQALVTNMNNGQWRFNGDTICFDADGTLLDGQHRLAAIVQSGKTIPCIIVNGLNPDAIKTKDMEIRCRSLVDLLSMDGITQSKLKSSSIRAYMLLKKNCVALKSRGKVPNNSVSRTEKTVEDCYNFYYENRETIDHVCNFCDAVTGRLRILTASNVAAIYLLLLNNGHDSAKIEDFFTQLCVVGGETQYIRKLQEIFVKDKGKPAPMMASVKQNMIAKAWNTFATGRKVRGINYNPNEGYINFL